MELAARFSTWVDGICPRQLKQFSLWLKQSYGYPLGPGLFLLLGILAIAVGGYVLLVGSRGGSFRPK